MYERFSGAGICDDGYDREGRTLFVLNSRRKDKQNMMAKHIAVDGGRRMFRAMSCPRISSSLERIDAQVHKAPLKIDKFPNDIKVLPVPEM